MELSLNCFEWSKRKCGISINENFHFWSWSAITHNSKRRKNRLRHNIIVFLNGKKRTFKHFSKWKNSWTKSTVFFHPRCFVFLRVHAGHVIHEFWLAVFERGATIFAHKHLGSPLTEAKLVYHAVNTCLVCLQWTALSERLVTLFALEWLDTSVCSYMTLQVKCVVEAFVAKRASITLVKGMSFKMPVQQASKWEGAVADFTSVIVSRGRRYFACFFATLVPQHANLRSNTETSIGRHPKWRTWGCSEQFRSSVCLRCFIVFA